MLAENLRELVCRLTNESNFTIADETTLPGRQPQFAPLPSRLYAEVQEILASLYPSGLYRHQADAIDSVLDGQDVCLSTSTASGKSLVFMALAAHELRCDPTSRVLALYPARALIQDQIAKWHGLLDPLGLSVGFIDGGVPMERRPPILQKSSVVLMTPDVAHAWLMSHLRFEEVRTFLSSLKLLVLDEAHVYEGAFGTNMAYFLRRLQVAAGGHRLICSTATLGSTTDFMEKLTGKSPRLFDAKVDGSASPPKTVVLVTPPQKKSFENTVALLVQLARHIPTRFLAFTDSRRTVEQIVAATRRSMTLAENDETEDEWPSTLDDRRIILPYRAGYEADDRERIQKALGEGRLAGVVATSALELGIDIGDIDAIALLDVPASVKAFWQRIGRAGRRNTGVCLLIDRSGRVTKNGGLAKYLQRPLEPSWLYLENRYIQYTNALCAAVEMKDLGENGSTGVAFASLPESFRKHLDNELNPTEIIDPDLYPLKQKVQDGPHREFPIRTGNDQEFVITGPFGRNLGTVTFSQALREAYPGAIYFYMARAYRVRHFNYRQRKIHAVKEKRYTTRPISQTMVFPRFNGGVHLLRKSKCGFLAEVELQVSERVTGFVEQRGATKEEHAYGPGSPYFQRELNRFFETTGVCWCWTNRRKTSDALAYRILRAFCVEVGVQERDLGVCHFHAKNSPLGLDVCQGMCIFDATSGSLRLTQQLAVRFSQVVEAASATAEADGDADAIEELHEMDRLVKQLRKADCRECAFDEPAGTNEHGDEWAKVIAPGEKPLLITPEGTRQVEIIGHRYTPQGLLYQLVHHDPGAKWMAAASAIQPLNGHTKMLMANLITGETRLLA